MSKAIAYQIATHIDLKKSKGIFNGSLLFGDSDELFYKLDTDKFIYIFQYGMICCFNLSQKEIEAQFLLLKPICRNYILDKISEKLDVEVKKDVLEVGFNKVVLPKLDEVMLRLVMLNASQSVALNRYAELTENLLQETNTHTNYLERKGKLDISGHKLKRFIGKTLNIKNRISENLYIFDSPEITWEDEKLNRLNSELKKTFDLKDRYHYIHDRIEIIKENLELFKDIMDHSESSRLEWIIIILILVEVVDMFILKFI
ncbi:RMD1 family protein [Winogradskyella alexanderae]|uniref:RMD1 family protein n=1 Tax=Winogradskyella alexanderae TaxID=2877123 RepID=A0ABS7XT45_9FLAO|nr:RMD1 family protein [Winogradskyella alexanderae]MCA0132549.1 RMD1 family protein [Winogradskyella alexanderae]